MNTAFAKLVVLVPAVPAQKERTFQTPFLAYARGFESKCIANGNRAVVIRGVATPEHAALEKSTPSRSGWRTQNGSARSGKFQTNPPQKNLQKLGEL